MRNLAYALTATFSLVLAGGCASTSAQVDDEPNVSDMQPANGCPLDVPGTEVRVSETYDGVAVIFVTVNDDVRDVQARSVLLAQALERRLEQGPEIQAEREAYPQQDDQIGGDQDTVGDDAPYKSDHDQADAAPFGVSSMVLPTRTGATLLFVPDNEGDVEVVRSLVQNEVDAMRAGSCPAR